jgi:hypothetical protein
MIKLGISSKEPSYMRTQDVKFLGRGFLVQTYLIRSSLLYPTISQTDTLDICTPRIADRGRRDRVQQAPFGPLFHPQGPSEGSGDRGVFLSHFDIFLKFKRPGSISIHNFSRSSFKFLIKDDLSCVLVAQDFRIGAAVYRTVARHSLAAAFVSSQ